MNRFSMLATFLLMKLHSLPESISVLIGVFLMYVVLRVMSEDVTVEVEDWVD